MSGFAFGSEAKENKPTFSYVFGQPSTFNTRAESKERKSLFSFGSTPVYTSQAKESKSLFGMGFKSSFDSEAKESKSLFGMGFTSKAKETKKVKKQLSQEEIDKKIQLKEERKKAKIELDKIKMEQAIKKSEMSYKMSDFYFKKIETFYNSLDESQSIFILSNIKLIYNLSKTFTEKAKLSYESTIKSTTVRQAESHAKEAQFAESVVFENYTKMIIEKEKTYKYRYKISHYTSNDFIKKELNEEEKFELKVDQWFKGKNFEQVIQKICEIIDSEKVKDIILSLKTHGNIMKAYKQLSLLFHPDKIDRDLDLTEFEKFKYNTVFKVINIAKSGK
jgi:hypothetical protein